MDDDFLSSGQKMAEIRNSFEADEWVFSLKSILFSIILLIIDYWLPSVKKKKKIHHKKYDFSISIISVNGTITGQLISDFCPIWIEVVTSFWRK